VIFETTTHRNSPTNRRSTENGCVSHKTKSSPDPNLFCSLPHQTQRPGPHRPSKALAACASTLLLCYFYTFLSLPCSLLAHRPFYYCIFRRRRFLDHRPSIFLSNGPRDTLSPTNSIICLSFVCSFIYIFLSPICCKDYHYHQFVTSHAPISGKLYLHTKIPTVDE
jgi:hypothetical protein